MRIAQILYNKAHWIFEAEEMPVFPPTPEGNQVVLIDITDFPEVQEGWDYHEDTQTFTEPIAPEPQPEPPHEPTVEEKTNQMLLNTEYLVIMQELNTGGI